MKKLRRTIVAALIAAALAVSSAAAFEKSIVYTDGTFSDVASDEWYASEVKSAYELGLMNGKGDGIFAPQGEVTVAEAVTMAARAAAAYYGETIPAADGEWYAMYVNYGMAKGFVAEGQFDSFLRPAKRYEVAKIFENAMPDGYFAVKNDVTEIPDVSSKQTYVNDLLTLYKAGVVMGSDSFGNFRPEDNIVRAEAAAIINRVALPENRLSKVLDKVSGDDAYTLVSTTDFNSKQQGINSGWLLDNRGGIPRATLEESYKSHFDISEEAGVALIREFNKTETGKFDVYADVSVSGGDGFYIEFRNEADKSVFRAEIINGKWNVLGADGKYTPFYDISAAEGGFIFYITLDLDNLRSTINLNGKDCGTFPLAVNKADANLYNFRFATTEKSLASFSPAKLIIHANYAVNEGFSNLLHGPNPGKWVFGDGAKVTGELSKELLSLEKAGGASARFNPVSGKAVAEFHVLLPEGEAVSVAAVSGTKNVALFTTDESAFYVNGTKVYDGYYKNLWYRVRLELDTDTQTILVKINGRKLATVPFAAASTSIDLLSFYNTSETPASFDNVCVFREVEHSDYVPVPVAPKGDDNYIIGMNVCSLWTNGAHFGWHCITPFDDVQSVLGYYDEGNRETADWEIKYLVEHGIDFQAFCVFVYGNGPINIGANHLFDGFMNAKYSDMAEFCMILEAANGDSPKSLEDWKTRWVPYIIENFFKHERHITVDNRPVLCMFGGGDFSKSIGGNSIMKEAFDYLEEETKKLGFDGVIYLCCGSSSDAMAEMGFDGCYAYNWGYTGYKAEVNKNSMKASAAQGAVYTVPTVSVGFNSVPWAGARYPMMKMADYKATNEWVKNEFLPGNAKEDWQKNLVMLSTWNEYGEGTYIMPVTGDKGFGYIDVIREVYTDEKADASINTVPTEAQKYRINHLYPQYRRLLRKEGYYGYSEEEEEVDITKLTKLGALDLGKMAVGDMWNVDKESVTQNENGVIAKGATDDPILYFGKLPAEINTNKIKAIKFTAKVPKDTTIQLFYTTSDSTGWDEVKCKTLTSSTDEMTEYVIPTSSLNKWTGVIKRVRIDPISVAGVEFAVKAFEFYGEETVVSPEDVTPIYTLPLMELKDDALWNITGIVRDENGVTGHGANDDPIVYFGKIGADIQTKDVHAIKITAKIPAGTSSHIYYSTSENSSMNERKKVTFISSSDEMTDYYIFTETLADWTGVLKQLRLDPIDKKEVKFTIKSIELCAIEGRLSNIMNIDGKEFKANFSPIRTENGELLVAFDPAVGLDFRLGLFHLWDKKNGVLTLKSAKHTITFTVGSDKYVLDGKQVSLGSKLGTLDGLPLIPIERLCGDLGYGILVSLNGEISISTPYSEYYNQPAPKKTPGVWDFNTVGNNESWSTSYMSLLTDDGYMSCESLINSYDVGDPAINLSSSGLSLPAEKYIGIEYKIRYKFESEKAQHLTMYYVTDVDGKWSESKTIKIPFTSTDSGEEFEIFTADLTKLEKWTGNITKLRFDPFNAKGHIDVDYIKFIENPDFKEPGSAEAGYTIPDGVEAVHEEYGELIWYADFENGKNNDAAYAAEGIAFTCGGTSAAATVMANPAGEGNVLQIAPSGAHGGFEIKFTDGLKEAGEYTFVADVYLPGEAHKTTWVRFGVTSADGNKSDPNFWKSAEFIDANNKWCEYPVKYTVTSQTINDYSFRKSQAETYYLDNVRIYKK